ncbi:Packaged DNA stabilization protein gp10 [Xenorhabdus bovienii str. puntauvense]|uniref:Packaged DNA stabilization protein gp10 n=1 Tax=Xenorhabdus bovienii str. puntauvense TaxID=1398201 RepID=A0A077NHS2_XENBV|nr:packaged DNA stabilization protein [Xenorhabdus bovienii]CDG98047.1 Packaged DNA stabilization protein gp10 [Xenorhabdus bovienii str. puntauvense]
MPIQQLPLMKGTGKDYRTADYVDLLPVNMLATPKEILGSSGYLRSFPGITKRTDVTGISRGAEFNTKESAVYRVLGSKLYKSNNAIGDVSGSGRISMAHSYNSQTVAANGVMSLYSYNGAVKRLENWPASSKFQQYEIGSVRDICRSRGRYIWAKDGTDTFGVTDLEDESHPDRYRALYRAESQPDGIIGIDTWRDFVVCFGSSTIEYFSLTGATDTQAAIYVAQPSLMVQKGIAGTHCKTVFGDSHAIISHQATGAPSVYVIRQGQVAPIATASIEKILRDYTADELAAGVMETVRFDAHELLIIHLPRHVLCYDAAASQNVPQWCILKTGLFDDVYRGIDFIFEGNQITVGDKRESVTGQLNFSASDQYGQQQEHLLYTPMFKADNARVFDFELEASTGVSQYADRLFLSATADGINYGREQMIEQNAPFVYDKRVLWRRVGRIRKNIGFKVRVITRSPVTLSGCQIRLE